MIEAHVREACIPLAVPGGKILLLGDQIPSFGSGYKNAAAWAESLGMTCQTIDYDGKADITLDLNYPLSISELKESADIVYDGGVLEHVANIGEAWRTTASLVKPGGCVIHCNPINCYGGAYYGLDPMLFRDIYEANGFTTIRNDVYYRTGWRVHVHNFVFMYLSPKIIAFLKRQLDTPQAKDFIMKDDVNDLKFKPLTQLRAMRFLPHLAHTFYVARKKHSLVEWKWPAQECYPRVTDK